MTTGATTLLSLALPVEGELDGTWGDVVNYGITDYVDIAVAGTLTLTGDGAVTLANTTGDSAGTNIGATTAQYAIIKIAGTLTATKVITAPSYSKTYIVDNTTATYGVTFKASGQTGVTVAAGEKCTVYYNGTDYVKVSTINVDGVSTISFGSTGLTPATATSGAVTVAGTLAVLNGGTGVTTSTGSGNTVLSTSPTLVTPILGTPQSATLTNATGLPISTGVSGLGTNVATFLATPSSANLAAALTDETGSGANVFATSPTLVTPILGTPQSATLTNATGLPISTGVSGLGTGVATALAVNIGSAGAPVVNGGVLGTPSSGTATNLTGLPLTTGVTGILPVANGGTATATPALVAGSGVSITGIWPNQTIAATGSGGTITSVTASSPLASSGGTTPNITITSSTGSGAVVLATSPTLVTPLLGTPTSGNLANCTFPTLNQNTTGTAAGLSATLAVASGGTGVTTSTGTGSVVLSSSPTLVTPALGTPASGALSNCTVDGTNEVGYKIIPQNSESVDYTLVLADSGKYIYHPSTDANARTFTIPANASVAYPIGTAISFVNMSANNVTIAITSDTMYWSGTGATGSRTLAQYGSATALKMTSTTWLITGSNLT